MAKRERLAPVCDHCREKRATHVLFRHPLINVMSEEDIMDVCVEDRVCTRCAYFAVRRGDVSEYSPIAG